MIKVINGEDLLREGLEKYLPRTSAQLDEIKKDVLNFVENVKTNGDIALIEYTKKFDKTDITSESIQVSEEEIKYAYQLVNRDLIEAIRTAITNIQLFHKSQIRTSWDITIIEGVQAGQILRPIESVGIYVPGGRAVYPSTVLMTAIPAKVAGVEEIVLCSPPGKFKIGDTDYNGIHPSILVAANECGVHKIFKLGSAWAIAAMAYGTQSVPSVQKIVGPGNKYVNAAKLLVKDIVTIDTPAGPSEVAIMCDEKANPEYITYDLISQVEHDPDNVGVVLTHDQNQIDNILKIIEKILPNIPRKEIVTEALNKYGLIVKTKDLDESIFIANEIATEHLEIMVEEPRNLLPKIKNAGAIFLGNYSPVPLGDYCAGTNHVLPTGGTAKRFSGLNTLDFMKIIDVLECNKAGIEQLEKVLTPIAEFEGLYGHRDAVKKRLE